MKVLFLGAGKRLSLLERFDLAARAEQVELEMMSAESRARVPIAAIARIIDGPGFRGEDFAPWLLDVVRAEGIDIVIPNMDAATVALSAVAGQLADAGVWAVVSAHGLCRAMEDKVLAEQWFAARGLRIPGRTAWPRILKRRLGFGSRDMYVARDQLELGRILAGIEAASYLEQEMCAGAEYTVDAYVDRAGRLVAAMPRQRLAVIDGEVNESLSAHHAAIEGIVAGLFGTGGWQGPLTAQFIDTASGPVLIEVNPRFGGGVTHAIHCGLDFPRWIIRERLGRPLPAAPAWVAGSFMTRCRRDVFL